MEARRMLPRPLAVALAALLVATALAPAAAADDCRFSSPELKVCDYDHDDRTDTVILQADEDGVGSVEVVLQDYSASDRTHRGGHASAATDGDSPVGAREAAAGAGCGDDASLVPCTDAGLRAGLGDDQTSASGRADCRDAVFGATLACDLARASVGADGGSQDVDAAARCGGVGGMGSPCPFDLRGSLEASTRAGDLAVYAWGSPFSPSVCEVDAHTDVTCVDLP